MKQGLIHNLFSFDQGDLDDFRLPFLDKYDNIDLSTMLDEPVPQSLQHNQSYEILKTNLELDLLQIMKSHGINNKDDIDKKLLYQLYSTYFSRKSNYPGLLGEISAKNSIDYAKELLEKYKNYNIQNFKKYRKENYAMENIRKYGCLTENDYFYKIFSIPQSKIPITIYSQKEFYIQTEKPLSYLFYDYMSKRLRQTNTQIQITIHYCNDEPDGYLGYVFVGAKGVLEIYDNHIPRDDEYLYKCKMANKIKGLPDTLDYLISWHIQNLGQNRKFKSKLDLIEKYGKTLGTELYNYRLN